MAKSLTETFQRYRERKTAPPPVLNDMPGLAEFFHQRRYNPFANATNEELVEHFRHWVSICARRNSQALASIPIHAYVMTGPGQKMYTHLRKGVDTRPVSKEQKAYLFSRMPLLLRKALEIEEVVEHPFLDLLKNVNPFMNQFDLIERLQLYCELTPNAYLYVEKKNGLPSALWVLPSQNVEVVVNSSQGITGFVYRASGKSVAYSPDEVVMFGFPSPFSLIYGFSPLQACLAAVRRKEKYDTYEQSLLENNARPDYLLRGKMSQPDAAKLREEWNALRRTNEGRGGVAVLSGDIELDTLGFTPEEMAKLEGQKFTRDEVAAQFDIPKSFLTADDINRANAETSKAVYAEQALLPRCKRMESKFNERILPLYDDRLFIAFDNPVPSDKEYELRLQEIDLKTGTRTINELRKERGLEAVEWGDEPYNPNPIQWSGLPDEPKSMIRRTEIKAAIPDETRQIAKEIMIILRQIYGEMQIEIIEGLTKTKALKDFSLVLDVKRWVEKFVDRIGAPLKRQLVRGAQAGLDRINAGISFDITNTAVQEWLADYTYHFAATTTQTLSDNLKAEFEQASRAGEGLTELTSRIQGFFGDMKDTKAQQIARTETSRAQHHGMREGWKQTDVVEGTQWQAHGGACPFCQEMHGKITPLDAPFLNLGDSIVAGGKVLTANYEPVMGGDLHPDCRCTLLAVLKGRGETE